MSYQIIYDPKDIPKSKRRKIRINKKLTLGIFAVLLTGILKISSWDDAFWNYLIPGDAGVTKSAFQNLTDSLENGNTFSDAITAFCDTVIQGAKLE